ncbi:hypothetical protein Sjap_000377 [Stephania japonica]|uniref:Uncharacterized protein n=1 Tax=Stephania japonica TaxID=461633 RepID=A0AAP0KKB0_9MAGN
MSRERENRDDKDERKKEAERRRRERRARELEDVDVEVDVEGKVDSNSENGGDNGANTTTKKKGKSGRVKVTVRLVDRVIDRCEKFEDSGESYKSVKHKKLRTVYWTGNGTMYRDLPFVLQKCFEMKNGSGKRFDRTDRPGVWSCGGVAYHHRASSDLGIILNNAF